MFKEHRRFRGIKIYHFDEFLSLNVIKICLFHEIALPNEMTEFSQLQDFAKTMVFLSKLYTI